MKDLFKNKFIQAFGIFTVVCFVFWVLGWRVGAILQILDNLSRWDGYYCIMAFNGLKKLRSSLVYYSWFIVQLSTMNKQRLIINC